MESKCPGQDSRKITAEMTRCRKCGYEIEMFSDEIRRTCPNCKSTAYREIMPSCLDWCRYAENCAGSSFLNKYQRDKSVLMSEKLLNDIEKHPGGEGKRINHAKEVLRLAEELLKKEKADFHIVVPAAVLHDAGMKTTEGKGAEAAKALLLKHGFRKQDIDEICELISRRHSPGNDETRNFKVLHDADNLANLKEAISQGKDDIDMEKLAEKTFLTKTGRALARGYIKNS